MRCAHKGLGECLIRLGDPNGAIRSLETALKLAPDLEAQLLAAQAFRRAEKLDEAETAYRRVLRVTRNHVDALVGLGELYLDLAERRADQRDSAGLAELYSKAISELTRAVNAFDSKEAPFTVASRKSSTLYLLAYAQVQLHQTSLIARDRTLINSAIRNFRACSESHVKAIGEGHLKAQRALDSILEDRPSFLRSWAERSGGTLVMALAGLLFVVAQVGLFEGRPMRHELLIFNPLSSETQLVLKDMPGEVATKIRSIETRTFRSSEDANQWLKGFVGNEPYTKFGSQIVATAKPGPLTVEWQNLDLAYYLALTFGSVLLMIAGAYLPQLTSLKLGGVQLEKASAERVETRKTIAISR